LQVFPSIEQLEQLAMEEAHGTHNEFDKKYLLEQVWQAMLVRQELQPV
jgi:hypothetical protein